VRRVPSSTIAHVSVSPLLIPDGRISRVRLAAVATFPEEPSQHIRSSSTRLHTPLDEMVISSARHPVKPHHCPALCPAAHSTDAHYSPRAPLPVDGVTTLQDRFKHGLGRSYPTFIARTDSCARPSSSCRLRFPYFDRSLQVATSPCWKMALPDVISAILV